MPHLKLNGHFICEPVITLKVIYVVQIVIGLLRIRQEAYVVLCDITLLSDIHKMRLDLEQLLVEVIEVLKQRYRLVKLLIKRLKRFVDVNLLLSE